MPIGARIFGPNRLLTSNCVVDVEAEAVNSAGGTKLTWAAVAHRVDVLLTLAGGGRDFAGGAVNERSTFVVSGVDAALDRPDVRLKVVECPDLHDLDGRYLAVLSADDHPAGRGGLLARRITLRCSVLDTPARALS